MLDIGFARAAVESAENRQFLDIVGRESPEVLGFRVTFQRREKARRKRVPAGCFRSFGKA
jgi:hypothetical protein